MKWKWRQNLEASQDSSVLESAGTIQDVTVAEPSGPPDTSNEEVAELGLPPNELIELRRLKGQPGFQAYLDEICLKYCKRGGGGNKNKSRKRLRYKKFIIKHL